MLSHTAAETTACPLLGQIKKRKNVQKDENVHACSRMTRHIEHPQNCSTVTQVAVTARCIIRYRKTRSEKNGDKHTRLSLQYVVRWSYRQETWTQLVQSGWRLLWHPVTCAGHDVHSARTANRSWAASISCGRRSGSLCTAQNSRQRTSLTTHTVATNT